MMLACVLSNSVNSLDQNPDQTIKEIKLLLDEEHPGY